MVGSCVHSESNAIIIVKNHKELYYVIQDYQGLLWYAHAKSRKSNKTATNIYVIVPLKADRLSNSPCGKAYKRG